MKIIIGLVTAAGLMLAADAPLDLHHGVVVLQELRTTERGSTTGVRHTFGGVQATTTPNVIYSNNLVADADGYRWEWAEAGERGERFNGMNRLVLPVGGTFEFSIDVKHNRYVILDMGGRKHFFLALRQVPLTADLPKPGAQ